MTDRNTDKLTASQVTVGSGNVFADLGLPNADEMFIKAQLLRQIYLLISDRQIDQDEAATILGVERSKVTDLMDGKFVDFSIGYSTF
jgi:predicted XRE-type DNA-binding protein